MNNIEFFIYIYFLYGFKIICNIFNYIFCLFINSAQKLQNKLVKIY